MADDDKKVDAPKSDKPSTSAPNSLSGPETTGPNATGPEITGPETPLDNKNASERTGAPRPVGEAKTAQDGKPGLDAGPPFNPKPSDAFKGPVSTSEGPVSLKSASVKPTAVDPKSGADGLKSAKGAGPGSEWTASDDRRPLERAEDGADTASGAAPEGIGAAPANPSSDAEARDRGPAPVANGTTSRSTASSPKTPVSSSPGGPGASQRSLWPVAAGILLGALIGAGSAALVYRGGSGDEATPDPQVTSLATRVDSLEKRPDPQAAVAALKSSVTALDNQVATLRKTVGAPGAGSAGAAAKPAAPTQAAAPSQSSPPNPAAVDLGPINEKIAALETSLADLKTRGVDTKALQDKLAGLESTVNGMKSATAAAQAGVSSVEGRQKDIAGEQKVLAGKVAAPAVAVVADSLVQQIDQGQPYTTQVEALVALGADPAKIAVLRQNADQGVPSAKMLAAKFEPLAEPIIATANKAPPGANLVDRLKSNMFSIVSVRRADDTSGTDLPSRVARIKTALAHDDVAEALKTFDALPADAKAKGTAWAALAKTRVEAMSAARALQHDTIVALGGKKS